MNTDDGMIDRLRSMIDKSQRAVIFTGAGISTESGIPDFRSPGGIWTQYQPIEFQDFIASEEARRQSWERKFATRETVDNAEPNRGHLAVAELVRRGKVSTVITQNVDGLHQKSGVPDDKMIELHGNSTYASCLDCGLRYELGPIETSFKGDGTLPTCDACDGIIKTATISFGQPMPEEAMKWAQEEAHRCDLFIGIGSSLVVYPAAAIPVLAKQNGADLIIINREPTELDGYADLVLNVEIGPTLGAAVGMDA